MDAESKPLPPPGSPGPPRTPRENHKGFLSAEDKRRYSFKVGILMAVFFVAQFLVPFAVMIPFMIMMFTNQMEMMKMPRPSRGALLEGAIWFPEANEGPSQKGKGKSGAVKRLKLEEDAEPERLQDLDLEDPWFLAGEDRLWIISASGVAFLRDDWITSYEELPELGDISPPFLYRGAP
ncbi:MAG: hypothetical protein ACYTFG_08680, partial [Planctomycetota bacterium]